MVGSIDLVAPTLLSRKTSFNCFLGKECKVDMSLNGFDEKKKSVFRWTFPKQYGYSIAVNGAPGADMSTKEAEDCFLPEFEGLEVLTKTNTSDTTSVDFVPRSDYFEGMQAELVFDWDRVISSGSGGSDDDITSTDDSSATAMNDTMNGTSGGNSSTTAIMPTAMGIVVLAPTTAPDSGASNSAATTNDAQVHVSFGFPRNARPGRYLLCWSKSSRGQRVKVAEIFLRGPNEQVSGCTLGVSCGISLSSPVKETFSIADSLRLIT
eukprot:GSA120T00007350001.1